APLIAETGGLNAMIVDSTALPEQAVRDIVVSAFQSAGQRCSALRVLYLQEDIAPEFLTMLHGAMDELMLGDPWRIDTDVGPVIDAIARNKIVGHIEKARSEGRVLKQVRQPSHGYFVPPTVLSVRSISELVEEIFGPVLHVALFGAEELDRVIHEVNATGFGLTFGMHSRIDDRVEYVTKNIHCGNVYINRNQIGAIVGSQPFGGEGLSGTGPKAGGPHYLPRFVKPDQTEISQESSNLVDASLVQRHLNGIEAEKRALTRRSLPGPTGESNRHAIYGRGVILCCGPGREVALKQAKTAQQHGCATLCIADGIKDGEGINGCLDTEALTNLDGFDGIISFADASQLLGMRQALACRDGKIIPLICEDDIAERCITERHVCIDTTAAGGNASLLVAAS
ncbi:MAG: aldehyde dehydrogenase family protein, partial [Pseudomonadota bacterium]